MPKRGDYRIKAITMDIFWIFQPLFILSKIFGHASFAYGDFYKAPVAKTIDQATGYLAVLVNLIIILLSIKGVASKAGSMFLTDTGSDAFKTSFLLDCCVMIFIILYGFFVRSNILKLLVKLQKCDKLFNELQLALNPQYQKRSAMILLVSVLAFSLFVSVATALSSLFFYTDYAKLYVVFSFMTYKVLHFDTFVTFAVSLVAMIWLRFKALNWGLYNDFCRNRDWKVQSTKSRDQHFLTRLNVCLPHPPTQQEIVLRYANIHHYLCDIVDLFNSCISVQVRFGYLGTRGRLSSSPA